MAAAGIPLVTVAPAVDETLLPGESSADYLARVVSDKLAAAIRLAGEASVSYGAVLVADTVVDLEGRLIDKPADEDAARRAIAVLAGRTHVVSTRFAIGVGPALPARDPVHVETVETLVTMRSLSSREVDAYVASREGFDKAGGYGIQGRAAGFVTRIEGSYTSVVGLPLAEVLQALARASLWG